MQRRCVERARVRRVAALVGCCGARRSAHGNAVFVQMLKCVRSRNKYSHTYTTHTHSTAYTNQTRTGLHLGRRRGRRRRANQYPLSLCVHRARMLMPKLHMLHMLLRRPPHLCFVSAGRSRVVARTSRICRAGYSILAVELRCTATTAIVVAVWSSGHYNPLRELAASGRVSKTCSTRA